MRLVISTSSDILSVKRLLFERDNVTYTDDDIVKIMHGFDSQRGLCYVVYDGDNPIAMATFERREHSNEILCFETWLYWENLYVAHGHRNGLAYAKIFRTAMSYVQAHDMEGIYCAVHKSDVISLHKRFGFEEKQSFGINIYKLGISFNVLGLFNLDRAKGGIVPADLVVSKNRVQFPAYNHVSWTKVSFDRRTHLVHNNRRFAVESVDGGKNIYSVHTFFHFFHIAILLGEFTSDSVDRETKWLRNFGFTIYLKKYCLKRSLFGRCFGIREYKILVKEAKGNQIDQLKFNLLDHDAI